MIRVFKAALCVAALTTVAVLAIDPHHAALAADTAPATGETTKVTWTYGATIAQCASAIGTLLFAGVMWALRLLPSQVYAVIVSMRADQLLQKAIDYGINMVTAATKDKALTADVGNAVLAQALQYVIDHAPDWLQSWMGGPDAIAQKIVARLNLASDAVPDVSAAVANVAKAA